MNCRPSAICEADCPQYNLDTQDRTTKFLRPFQLLKADGGGPPFTLDHHTEPRTVLFELKRINGGPSAILKWTVRRYISSRNVPR